VAYQTDLPGIEEARLDAIQGLIASALADLNAALQRDGLWPSAVPITPSMVTIGSSDTPLDVSAYPLLISVAAGGREDDLDIATDYLTIDPTETAGTTNTLYTNIFVALHPDAVTGGDPVAQAQTRERIRARVCDWLRAGVFNTRANLAIPLASREYAAAPAYDVLDRCRAATGRKGLYTRSYGAMQTVYGAHIVHVGEVR
jgi:hypothetical protein